MMCARCERVCRGQISKRCQQFCPHTPAQRNRHAPHPTAHWNYFGAPSERCLAATTRLLWLSINRILFTPVKKRGAPVAAGTRYPHFLASESQYVVREFENVPYKMTELESHACCVCEPVYILGHVCLQPGLRCRHADQLADKL